MLFGVTVLLYFIKILSGSHKYNLLLHESISVYSNYICKKFYMSALRNCPDFVGTVFLLNQLFDKHTYMDGFAEMNINRTEQ